MSQDMQRHNSSQVSSTAAVGIIYLAARSLAATVTPFFRSNFGAEAFHPYALFALVILASLTQGRWKSVMGGYMIAWVLAMAYRRFETFRQWWKGNAIHSRYIGDPWLALKFPFVKTAEQARGFEPVMCLAAGAALCVVHERLGLLVMSGFVSLGASTLLEKLLVLKRVQRMHDAQIEGEFYAGEFRQWR